VDDSTRRKPGLAAVAKLAGVSKASASYALHGSGKISEATRQRVIEAARELGYALPAAGEGPADERGRQHDGRLRIAWLSDGAQSDDPRCGPALYRARDIGYRAEHFASRAIGELRAWRDALQRAGYRGLILASRERCAEALAIDWQPLAAVCCEPAGHDGPYTSILAADPVHELLTCFERARAAGYARIGCVIHDRGDGLHRLRLAAVHCAQALHAEGCEAVPVHQGEREPGAELLRWARVQRPDLIIGSDPAQLYALRRDGVRAGFVSIDCPPGQNGIAGTIVDPRTVGATAVNAVDQLLRFNRSGRPDCPRRISLAIRWQDGTSFPPQRP
jgi:LacI family transcriptional regulator